MAYTIRALHTLDEMVQAVELQRTYWGNDLESVVPAHMLFTITQYGGHVIAAFDDDKMIAVLIGLIGTNEQEDSDRPAMANLVVASKRMVVLPEYRSSGIGYKLKLEQRRRAIKQGIRLVTWTFNPLLTLNAHLNLRKLGCVVEKYHVNLYGSSDAGGLSDMGWSDRLHADWWVTHRRVEVRLSGERGALSLPQYLEGGAALVNPARMGDHYLIPTSSIQMSSGTFALIEMPLDYPAIAKADPHLAQDWQMHTREVFLTMLRAGYIVTDFLRDTHEGRDRGFYLLSYNMGFDFRLN